MVAVEAVPDYEHRCRSCRTHILASLECVPLHDQRASKQNGMLSSTREQEARKPTQSRVGAEDSDDSDTDGGLVLVRKGDRRGDDVEEDNSLDMLPLQKKAKKLRITSDGMAALSEARKKVFDDDVPEVMSVVH